MHHAANTDISALPLDVLDIRTDCALRFHVDAPYLHAEMLGIDRPVVWIGPDGYEVGHRIEWGATHGEVAIMPVANFGGVERWHVFAGGGASFANTDFSVLPADTIVSCVNDTDPRVSAMELVFDTSLGDTGDYEPVLGTVVGLPLAPDGTEYELEIEVTPEGRDPVYRRVSGTVAETEVSGEGIGVSYEESTFNEGVTGEHRIKVAGAMPKMAFRDQHYEDIPNKLVAVVEWSDLTWDDTVDGYNRAFHGCANLLTTGFDVSFDGTDWVPVAGSDAEYVPSPTGGLGRALTDCVRYGDPDRVGADCDIGQWDTAAVTSLSNGFVRAGVFGGCAAFNQPLPPPAEGGGWDVSNATNARQLFRDCESFDQDIGGWDTSSLTNLLQAFRAASAFNNDGQPLSWDVSSVENMSEAFLGTDFAGQGTESWDTSSLVNLRGVFQDTPFNADISGWDVSGVTSLATAFRDTPFNQDISGWDVSSVESMWRCFNEAPNFNQDLSAWDVTSLKEGSLGDGARRIFADSGMAFGTATDNLDSTIISWSQQAVQQEKVDLGLNVSAKSDLSQDAQDAVDSLCAVGWRVTDNNNDSICP